MPIIHLAITREITSSGKDWSKETEGWNEGAHDAIKLQDRFEKMITDNDHPNTLKIGDYNYENEFFTCTNSHMKKEIQFMHDLNGY